ncbi:MAG: cell wall hydrolase [Lachnospiraceae bacterium]|nr:cell wall hydrolase [Lachnospiraceae bacterium]
MASVVWNRINSDKYPDNMIDVIYQRNGSVQFSPTYDGRIDIVKVTEDDVLAIEYTYIFDSTAYDCIAFDNVSGNSWNKNKLEEIFTDSINHTFYR